MKNMKRSVALLVAIALLIGCAAGGTMAWLTMKTQDVVNTFTVGNIDITLTESDADVDIDDDGDIDNDDNVGDFNNNSYKMVPGAEIAKNPTVTVEANSEACWLFVKVDKSENFNTYMEYAMATGWQELSGETGVYYREVVASSSDQPFGVIQGDKITVKNILTKSDMDAASNQTLTFTAYAIQHEGFDTVADAWNEAKSAPVYIP
ncbi:MAG: hypothetical protein IJC12_06260 [Peptococcaceae bacterium]|nr:hypothetical protein [Peptococcaceae bacterium]